MMILLNLNQHIRTPTPSSIVASAGEMANIRRLLSVLAAKEDEVRGTRFLAPCVGGCEVTMRGGGLVYAFTPEPRDFEGWGVFEPIDESTAELIEEAAPRLIEEYLKPFKQIRLRLAYRMRGQTWLAHPVNEADARQRLGTREAQQVYLTSEGAQFEQIVARWDGSVCWFEEVDRRADPTNAERLRKGFQQKLRYQSDERRLEEALAFGGGRLISFEEQGDCWEVLWATPNEYSHTSIIRKQDLTVVSAGFCLSGQDSDFDLQSLVKVAEVGSAYDW
ncbi:MAG TPA: hypothetical protein VEQ40_11360 [Pyrinomonadaceae bacterium]|nr:hypothetical protein [Pyrinomonadaceae bacterium]